jgi:hypothetical protein
VPKEIFTNVAMKHPSRILLPGILLEQMNPIITNQRISAI